MPTAPAMLSLRLGSAYPIGDFSKTRFDDTLPAFAAEGLLVQLSYTHPVRPLLVLGATTGYRSNPFQEDAFAKDNDDLVISIQSTGWRTAYALADVQLQVPLHTKTAYYLRGSVGGAFNRSASLLVETRFGTIKREKDTAIALMFGLSSGVQFTLNRVVLDIGGSLLNTQSGFEVVDAQGNRINDKQPLNTASITVGVGYPLARSKE
ncbi:hypothetical protein ACXYMU_12505 [Pontibacter sp. CAU 1760]